MMEMAKEHFIDNFGVKKAEKATYPIKKDEDGTYTLKVTSKKPPKIVDAKGNPVLPEKAAELRIGSGTLMKVKGSFKIKQDGSGVTAYFDAVQIIELVEYSSGGFGAEEGSFEAPAGFAEEKAEASAEVSEEDIDF
jgi:hypothetical protein